MLSRGQAAEVLQLVKQQKLGKALGQALKHAVEQLFKHLGQLPCPNDVERSIDLLMVIVTELFASCHQWGAPDTATSALLVARQLAESGMLA
jgi:hypothetical protein